MSIHCFSIAVSGPPRNTSMNETRQSRTLIEASLPSIVTSIACPGTIRVPSQTFCRWSGYDHHRLNEFCAVAGEWSVPLVFRS